MVVRKNWLKANCMKNGVVVDFSDVDSGKTKIELGLDDMLLEGGSKKVEVSSLVTGCEKNMY